MEYCKKCWRTPTEVKYEPCCTLPGHADDIKRPGCIITEELARSGQIGQLAEPSTEPAIPQMAAEIPVVTAAPTVAAPAREAKESVPTGGGGAFSGAGASGDFSESKPAETPPAPAAPTAPVTEEPSTSAASESSTSSSSESSSGSSDAGGGSSSE